MTVKKPRKKKMNRLDIDLTKEDLRKMGLIQNTDGRPLPSMTDKSWQVEFELRKRFITPHPAKMTKLKSSDDCSINSSYCAFINSVLKEIRSGSPDYVFYIYQIEDLLKFHKNDLRTMYLENEECFMVWLGTDDKNK